MRQSRWSSLAMLCVVSIVLQGCSATVYWLTSTESLSKVNPYSSSRYYTWADTGETLVDSGIEFSPWLYNNRMLHYYQFFVPVDTFIKPPSKPREKGMSSIGRSPFDIDISFRADGDGATFDVFATELYLEGHATPISPSSVLKMRYPYTCVGVAGLKGLVKINASDGIIPVVNKSRFMENDQKSLGYQWTCVEISFDIPTPDPSEKFQLKLGEIVTPEDKRIRPMIYFYPVTIKEQGHAM